MHRCCKILHLYQSMSAMCDMDLFFSVDDRQHVWRCRAVIFSVNGRCNIMVTEQNATHFWRVVHHIVWIYLLVKFLPKSNLRDLFLGGNINIYSQCRSFIHIELARVIEIFPQIRHERTNSTLLTSWMLKFWRSNESGYDNHGIRYVEPN